MSIRTWCTVLCCLATIQAVGEEASYRLTGGAVPVSAASNGYAQVVEGRADGSSEVRVATTLAPIGAEGTYADVSSGERPQVPTGFELPRPLSQQLRPNLSAWQAATLVLEWVADNIAVDADDYGEQDAASVLARRRGRCSGIANASVALLQAAGFEARTISGLLIGDDRPIPHRWIECRLPAAGWVASDPTLGLWAITPRHLVFAETVIDLPEVLVLESSGDGLDRLPKRGGRFLRPNRGADLVCRLAPDWPHPGSVAVLRGGGGETRRARFDPEARFSDLLPGRWILEILSGDSVVERRHIDLAEGDFRSFVVAGEPPAPRRGSGS